MSIGAILIGLAMLIGVIPFVLSPLLSKRHTDQTLSEVNEEDAVEVQHQKTLLALRDLEFDHQVGKVGDEDFNGLRATLMVQAAASLEAAEEIDADLNARLEEAIRLRREKQSKERVCSHCGKSLDTTDRFCRACGKSVQGTCLKCGELLAQNDMFCSKCGYQLGATNISISTEGAS